MRYVPTLFASVYTILACSCSQHDGASHTNKALAQEKEPTTPKTVVSEDTPPSIEKLVKIDSVSLAAHRTAPS
ncbi:MAG: hypothetical protein IPJ88_12385 [Myxococcales bacterium]|nr:MAG: hypothetical protein IPJ88_12385 [Myxococcales bacterium]